LDDIFTDLIPDPDGAVRCALQDQRKGMQTVIEFDAKQFPNVVVYTPSAPRQAICIEPYTCPTDAFNLHDRGIECNLLQLHAGERTVLKLCIYTRNHEE
jgi:aldose 1-epimerase